MRRSSLFWGAVLVLVGVILLLDNLGLLGNVDVWSLIWPLFLVGLGVWMLLGTVFRRSPEREHANIPLDGAQRARLKINHGAGRLDLSSGAGMADLVEGDFGGGLSQDSQREGDLLDVRMRMPVQIFPFFWWPGSTLDWSLRLNREIPTAIDLETGASDARIDLGDLQVTDLHLKSGASSTNLTLPANAGQTRVDIESGAASVNIHVPTGVAARIHARGGLSSVNVDSTRFPRLGDAYQSADFETAANRADIRIEMGVGSVNVR